VTDFAKTTAKPPKVDDRCTYCGHEFARHTRAEYSHSLKATTFRCENGCVCRMFISRGRLYLVPDEAER